ncbi:MAG: SGNH/GDSL hydrolase family protein [Planctomycetaceae bacterium]|nr:SGNH/GDSL hydrolase family protein [Planctomycetaceae bacterium]
MIVHASSLIPKHLAWIIVLAVTMLGTSLRAGDIAGIVAFGDSLSDVGNTYIADGIPPPPYYRGHYSNGPIWLEYLANSLGVPAPTASLAGGTDNAWGGAETGNGLSFEGTPNIGLQISTYLASNTLSRTQLITIWGGANDFLNGGQTNPAVPVDNLISEITTLAAAGGKQFLVPNLPLLGDLPATNTLPPANRDALNYLTLSFDSMLYSQLNQLQGGLGITIHQVDIDSLFQNIIANPGAYGLTNVTDSAIADGNLSGQGYLFWDTVHPTTEIQAVIGAAAFATVPEPSSLTLVLIAAPLLLAWRRRAAFTSPGPRPRDGNGRG